MKNVKGTGTRTKKVKGTGTPINDIGEPVPKRHRGASPQMTSGSQSPYSERLKYGYERNANKHGMDAQ